MVFFCEHMTTENNSNNKRKTVIATIAILLLIGSLVYVSVQHGRNANLEKSLKEGKLTSESLLSEKLFLEKEILKFKSELQSLEGTNSELDKSLHERSQRVQMVEAALRKMQKQSGSITLLKKQSQALATLKYELEQQLAYYKQSLRELQVNNEELVATVELLQHRNKDLAAELDAVRLASMDEVLTESVKKNGKLSVKAARTKAIIVNVNVPAAAENVTFKIKDPAGNVLAVNDGSMTFHTIMDSGTQPQAFYVSTNSAAFLPRYKKMQMVYHSNKKLQAGIYVVEIQNNSQSIGTLQVKLR